MKSFTVFSLAVLLAPVALAQQQTFIANPDGSDRQDDAENDPRGG